MLCEEVGRCEACREKTYLMEGYCTPNCGHGYYADLKTRTCQGDETGFIFKRHLHLVQMDDFNEKRLKCKHLNMVYMPVNC